MKPQVIENLALAVKKAIFDSGLDVEDAALMVYVDAGTLEVLKADNPLYVDRDGDFFASFPQVGVAVLFLPNEDLG